VSAVLEIRDLGVQRDRRALLSDVSLDVARGSAHLLVGPNGAGKTTLLSAILGRVEFTGSIRFHWEDSGRIGYVPQSFAVDPTLPVTVGEFLALGHQRRPVCVGITRRQRHRIDEVLGRVGLSGFASRPLSTLSGGELQRMLLANAVDPRPELLLLDEPASGLDETAVGRLEEVLRDLKREARTSVFMVSHDLGQVRRIADAVTLLDRRVRRTGPPATVLTQDLAASLALAAEPGER
jgi:zinc transport system ATP-binding protein